MKIGKNRVVCSAVAVALVCFVSLSYAQINETVELGEIKFVNVADYEQNIADVPASVFVITKKDRGGPLISKIITTSCEVLL